jgi:hypothetical protein
MPAPPGYSHVVFDDNFGGTTLDASKWIPQIADQFGVWDNGGSLSPPLSASGAGQFDAEYFSPDAVKVSSGLTLVATRDQSQQGYTWKSGCITTHGKFTFPRGYAQFRVKMPDSTAGMWGGLWFLEGGAEIDLIETGYTNHGPVNQALGGDGIGGEPISPADHRCEERVAEALVPLVGREVDGVQERLQVLELPGPDRALYVAVQRRGERGGVASSDDVGVGAGCGPDLVVVAIELGQQAREPGDLAGRVDAPNRCWCWPTSTRPAGAGAPGAVLGRCLAPRPLARTATARGDHPGRLGLRGTGPV